MGKKFVMSYSFGKDSTLSLDRMIRSGHTPVALLVMVNKAQDRLYFHGVNYTMMQAISDSLGIPLLIGESVGTDYREVMIATLKQAKALGAELAVFGDIDIDEHLTWCSQQCQAADISCKFPLWQENRASVVSELLAKGYRCIIKVLDPAQLPKSLLGQALTPALISQLVSHNVDVCGENGEYHTVVVDGPIFQTPIHYALTEVLDFPTCSAVDMLVTPK